MSDDERRLGLMPAVIAGGLIFGLGLVVSNMARPEVVLDFLQFDDPGLVFVMDGAAVVTGTAFALAEAFDDRAPLTGRDYGRRLKPFDKNVVADGVAFEAGWGISGACPGAAYASLGVDNYPILIAIGGVFVGAYLQGLWCARHTEGAMTGTSAD